MSASSPKAKRGPIPKDKRSDHIPRSEVPDDDVRLQLAVNSMIRILTGAFDANQPPPVAEQDDIDLFFSLNGEEFSEDEVQHLLRHGKHSASEIRRSIRNMRLKASTMNGQTAKDLLKIPESHLTRIYICLHKVGLPNFRFDWFGQSKEGVYHQTMEFVFVHAFQLVATANGFQALGIVKTNLLDQAVVSGYFRSFVWGRLFTQYKLDHGPQGQTGRNQYLGDMKQVYTRRENVRNLRLEHMRGSGFPARVLPIVEENECHSDDQAVLLVKPPGYKKIKRYYVKTKQARNPDWKFFIGAMDEEILKDYRDGGSEISIQKLAARVPDPDHGDAQIPRLPIAATLDFYDPTYFNSKSAAFRIHFKDTPIAFPLPEDTSPNPIEWSYWKSLSDGDFEEEFGWKVRACYIIPTAEEAENAAKNGYGRDEDNTESPEDNQDGPEGVHVPPPDSAS
ncbi:hypothetical protein DL96DRAFT_1684728 [Flagelloscypha sp. PMI_526]|nr:hypothetical protein DL96DRAFT_1684728 [Flagelloscypha sp. PMI_526]